MNIARPSDGLLPANDTIRLIELLKERERATNQEKLLRDFAVINPISWTRARNTIAKLTTYGVFRENSSSEFEVREFAPKSWRKFIAKFIIIELMKDLTEANAWSCIRFETTTSTLKIDSFLLPAMKDGLATWVTEFGIARRTFIADRYWVIAPEHEHLFLAGVSKANTEHPRRAKSAIQLAADLERQAEHGKAAEHWVLEYERQRLSKHPLKNQIRCISTNDVSAGYDIISFASQSSLQHDFFIEVKSHGDIKLFHWSRNEIAVAREFGESYALYLIDRTQCSEPNYIPHIIVGPTPEMFAATRSGWKVEATSFEHIALKDS